MTKTIVGSTLLASIFLVLQSTWLKNGLFWGVIPDIAFLVIIWVSYNNKSSEGVFTGFLTGFVCDLVSSSPLGYFSFIYILPAYALSFLKSVLVMDKFFVPVLMGFAGTILKGLASFILLALFGSAKINAYSMADLHFWVEAALNGAIAPLVFLLLNKLRRLLVTRKVTE
jgi:rod shape-determining protein MreD